MSLPLWMSLMRRVSVSAVAALFAAGVAGAQSTPSQTQSTTPSYSSSLSGLQEFAELAPPNPTAPGASALGSGRSAAGQYGNGGGYGGGRYGFLHHYAFEAGAGFNAPIGNDTNQSGVVSQGNVPVITWGGNFTAGGGLRFNRWLSVLAEYQFMDNKLPGALIADVNTATGGVYDLTAGNTHINSITGSPVIDLFPKRANGIYLVGGWGWYRKSTNFQTPEEEFSYYGYYYGNVTVASFTSNQWGGNAGFGLYHRLGGRMYGGESGHTEIFAETRYTFIHTPPPSQSNGLGTTELIPVTFGVRF